MSLNQFVRNVKNATAEDLIRLALLVCENLVLLGLLEKMENLENLAHRDLEDIRVLRDYLVSLEALVCLERKVTKGLLAKILLAPLALPVDKVKCFNMKNCLKIDRSHWSSSELLPWRAR